MNILYLTDLFPMPINRNSGIFIQKRLESIKKEKIDFDVYCPAIEKDYLFRLMLKMAKKGEIFNDFPEKLNVNDIEYNYIKKRFSFYSFLKCYDKIAEAFIDELEKTNKITFPQYDLIHAHFAYPSGFIAKYFSEKYGIPYFVTLHGSDIHSIPYRNEKMKPIIVDVLEGAEKCIFISEALREKAIELGYRNENAIIIPNGFDPEIFCYIDKSEAKKKLGIDKTKCIGFVGNLIELKNVMLLPNIFEKVKRQYDDVNFVIVGDGELRYKLQKLCEQKLLDVSFTGFLSQEKVADYMRAMDVMVLPSKKEGFGAVLVEAQACGTYCIGSDRGGIPEAIGNKDAIFSLEDDFIENASKHILNILENGFFQGKILKRVEAYTWEHITDKVIKLYKQKRIMNSYNSLFLETDSFLKEN